MTRRSLLLSVMAALTALAALTVIGTGERAGDRCMRDAEATYAGDGVQINGWSWWPLGARCQVTRHNGEVENHVVPPW